MRTGYWGHAGSAVMIETCSDLEFIRYKIMSLNLYSAYNLMKKKIEKINRLNKRGKNFQFLIGPWTGIFLV